MPHGAVKHYVGGCRCLRCQAAWRAYHAAYRALKAVRGECQKCSQKAVYGTRCAKHRQVTKIAEAA